MADWNNGPFWDDAPPGTPCPPALLPWPIRDSPTNIIVYFNLHDTKATFIQDVETGRPLDGVKSVRLVVDAPWGKWRIEADVRVPIEIPPDLMDQYHRFAGTLATAMLRWTPDQVRVEVFQ